MESIDITERLLNQSEEEDIKMFSDLKKIGFKHIFHDEKNVTVRAYKCRPERLSEKNLKGYAIV